MDTIRTTERMFATMQEGKDDLEELTEVRGDSVDKDVRLLEQRNWENLVLGRVDESFERNRGPHRRRRR
jgi:hypothetical protein